MASDLFGKPLTVGDSVLIDAKVAEVFDPEEDDVHIRIALTNGNGQSLVIRADAVALVLDDETERVPENTAAAVDQTQTQAPDNQQIDTQQTGAKDQPDAGKEGKKSRAAR